MPCWQGCNELSLSKHVRTVPKAQPVSVARNMGPGVPGMFGAPRGLLGCQRRGLLPCQAQPGHLLATRVGRRGIFRADEVEVGPSVLVTSQVVLDTCPQALVMELIEARLRGEQTACWDTYALILTPHHPGAVRGDSNCKPQSQRLSPTALLVLLTVMGPHKPPWPPHHPEHGCSFLSSAGIMRWNWHHGDRRLLGWARAKGGGVDIEPGSSISFGDTNGPLVWPLGLTAMSGFMSPDVPRLGRWQS